MLDVSKPQGFIRRGNNWYYRRRVPLDVLTAFGGQRGLQERLKTGRLDEAKIRRDLAAAKLDALRHIAKKSRVSLDSFASGVRSLGTELTSQCDGLRAVDPQT